MTDMQNQNADFATQLKETISLNFDARHYFFSKADERWFDWLRENGFLDVISVKPEMNDRYSYRMPELDYLGKVAEKIPEKVTDFILKVKSEAHSFNPEVIDRFLTISAHLPPQQIKRLAPKIRAENWARLMSGFEHWGYEYEKLLQATVENKDFESLLQIAEDILSVKDETSFDPTLQQSREPFYFKGLRHLDVFRQLSEVGEEFVESALGVAINALSKIVSLNGRTDDGKGYKDGFQFYSVDFFELQLDGTRRMSERDDVVELAAAIKVLTVRLIGSRCSNPDEVRRIYESRFDKLPNNGSTERLKIFVISRCPEVFTKEIQNAVFSIFQADDRLAASPEYKHLLQNHFGIFDEKERHEFVIKVIDGFGQEVGLKSTGHALLSCVSSFLSKEDQERSVAIFGPLNPEYQPHPWISQGRGGMVVPQAPNEGNEWQDGVIAIVDRLKNGWSPQGLSEKYRDDDFLRPRNAEGVGEKLKNDISARPLEYLSHAKLFFDRVALHPHYTYCFLQGTSTALRGPGASAEADVSELFSLMDSIRVSGLKDAFQNSKNGRDAYGWLGSWDAVHGAMAEMLKDLLQAKHDELTFDFSVRRPIIVELLKYLLSHRDPEPKDEVIETAKSKTKSPQDADYMVSDPFTNAINSVRGKAFQALFAFIFHDGKTLEARGETIRLSEDIKSLYDHVLCTEETRALMFMFGHLFHGVYFRDQEWALEKAKAIFARTPGKEHLCLAAFEGYLVNNLHKEVFFNPFFQELYKQSILNPIIKDARRYFRDPEDGLATHLAIAFSYFLNEFDREHRLFKIFWYNADEESLGEFIGYFGRAFVSGRNDDADTFLYENPELLQKMKDFWEWASENCKRFPQALSKFDFWMNQEKNLFEMTWLAKRIRSTLEKTGGALDWDYGLTRIIGELAETAPEDALEIIRLHLFEYGLKQGGRMLYLQNEWETALKILFGKPGFEGGTRKLINDLIEKGGKPFWGLEQIIRPGSVESLN